jgi:hypothetical protein
MATTATNLARRILALDVAKFCASTPFAKGSPERLRNRFRASKVLEREEVAGRTAQYAQLVEFVSIAGDKYTN